MGASTRVRAGVVAVALAAAAVVVAGCDSSAPSAPAQPTGFEEVSSQFGSWSNGYETFCNHGNRVYGSTGGGLAVVPGDPSCKTP